MKPTKKQLERRTRPFFFSRKGSKSWFYLDGSASFHQPEVVRGQQDVFGLPVFRLVAALKACGYIALFLCLPALADAKEIAMPYDDFLQVLAKVEHAEKLKNKAAAENGVLVKLKGEQEAIIKIQAEQIAACEQIVQNQDQLRLTDAELEQAIMRELRKEKRLSRYKSEAFWIGVAAIGLWVVN